MWWMWALILVALLAAVIVLLNRRGSTGNVRKEELANRPDQPSGPDTLGGGVGGM